jgi:hypothetical protein
VRKRSKQKQPAARPALPPLQRSSAVLPWATAAALATFILTGACRPQEARTVVIPPPRDAYGEELIGFLTAERVATIPVLNEEAAEPAEPIDGHGEPAEGLPGHSGAAVLVGPNGMIGEPLPEAVPQVVVEEEIIPLEVRIAGPVDVLVGDMVELVAETTDQATSIAWSIEPEARGLVIMDDGTKAVFSNRQAGEYLLIVSCANHRGDTAHATMRLNLRPAPPENPLTVESLADAAPPPDLRDLIRRWVAEVQSDAKPGELAAVASSLRQTANLLANNSLALTGDGDPLYEVEAGAEIAMGPGNFPKWASFFGRVRDFLYPLNQRGYVVSATDYANTFNNIATELEAIAAGR